MKDHLISRRMQFTASEGSKYGFGISLITKFFLNIIITKKGSRQKNCQAAKRNIASKCCTFNTFYFQYAKGAMLHVKMFSGRSNFMISLPKNTISSVARFLVSLIRYIRTQFTAIDSLVFTVFFLLK